MQEPILSWRHLIALLVTGLAMGLAWHASQIAPTPPLAPPRVMHIQLAPPPPPPPPQPPEKAPPAPTPPHVARLPQADDKNAVMPAQTTPPPQPVTQIVPPPATPPAPPAPAAPQVDTVSLENAYAAKVYAAVEAQKRYPMSKDARLEQPSGVVAVWLMLSRAGAILDAGIAQSHGSILDRQALQSVRSASFPPIPADAYAGQEQHRFVVELNFIPP